MRIAVVWSGGQWRTQGDVACQFKEGTAGVLHVGGLESNSRKSRKKAATRRVFSLPTGTELRVALTVRSNLDKSLQRFLAQADTPYDVTAKISCESRFVSLWLRGRTEPKLLLDDESDGLCFVFSGMKLRRVELGAVAPPSGLDLGPLASLNHAFTRLSEVFEPWRMAHTGNIYQRVFYERPNGQWGRLEELRVRAVEKRRSAADASPTSLSSE